MLFRKLLRTMLRYKAQFTSMILMTALGVGIFVGFNMEWYSLLVDTERIFAETGFADYRIIDEDGFMAEDVDAIKNIDGVEDATRFLSFNADVINDNGKKSGDSLALTAVSNPAVSFFKVMKGEEYSRYSEDGIWISDRYADENNINIGDRIKLKYSDYDIECEVKGLIKSSEYLICVPDSTQLMPDYSKYGYAYVSPFLLRKVFGFEFYTQINFTSDLSKAELIDQIDEALGKTSIVLSKEEVISYSEAHGEMQEGKTMAKYLPVLFLAIALLTMVTTMHRLTSNEKTQIGMLKALGFKNRRIQAHYTAYALIIGLVGSVLGLFIGYGLCYYIINPNGMMATYIDMYDWSLNIPSFCWFVLAGIIILMTLVGFLSVNSMLKGSAADSLRPYTPKPIKRLAIENFSVWSKLGFGTKWNLRDLLRHKSRTMMSLVGIVGCTLIMIASFGMKDTMNSFLEKYFDGAYRYKTCIYLDTENVDNAKAREYASKYEGDTCAESSVQLAGKAVSVDVYNIKYGNLRFLDDTSELIDIDDSGAYICRRLAEDNNLSVGDSIEFSPFGSDDKYTVRIAGVTSSLTENISMTEKYADQIGYEYKINMIYTREKGIDTSKDFLSTTDKDTIVESFDTFMQIMNTMIYVLALAALLLGVVVLYNLGVMSYTERYREMATLKVVGFKDKQIGRLLIDQNLWLTVIGVIIGAPLGKVVLDYLCSALAAEYELTVIIAPMSYIVSAVLTIGMSLLVGLMISRRNRKIDMIAALKGVD